MPQTYLTPEGLEKLKKELEALKKNRRPEIIRRIEAAKELGDLSENAEYTEAKEEQSFIEGRILKLEEILKIVQVIDQGSSREDLVTLGSRVKVKKDEKESVFFIVGSQEVAPLEGKISNESPLGQALLGRRVGEKVKVEIPKGMTEYEILEIR